MTPTAPAAPVAPAVRWRRSPGPALPLPDGHGFLPTAFAAAFLLLLYRLARRRLRTQGPVAWSRLTGAARARVSPAMRRAVDATRSGVQGRLETLVRARLAGTAGHPVGHALAALETAGAAAGLPDLPARVRYVLEGSERLTLVVEAQDLAPDAVPRVAARLADALGTPVTPGAPTQEPDGISCLTLEVRRAPLTLLGPLRRHAAPLVVPLAQTESGTVLHLHVARTSGLLIAGGPYGANTLVAALVASALAQAPPEALRLLVASDDEDLRDALGGQSALAVPPVDADDGPQTAALVGQAYAVLLERFARGGRAPDEPAYLVVVDNVERLGARDGVLGQLESICRNGRLCGMHLVATTSDVAALHAAALVDAFGVRLLRQLPAEESQLLRGDGAAALLGAGAALLWGGPALVPADARLVPFALPLPDLREVLAALVAAESGAALPTVDATAGAPAPPTPPADTMSPAPTAPAAPTALAGTEVIGMAAEAAHAPDSPDPVGDPAAGGRPDTAPADAVRGGDPVPTPGATQGGAAETVPVVAEGRDAAEEDTPADALAGAPVSLRLFGSVTLAVRGVTVPLPPRGRRVLAALALLGPGPVQAERVADLLYGTDGSAEDAEPVDPADMQERVQRGLSDVRARVRRAGLSDAQAAAIVVYKEPTYVIDPTLVEVDVYRFDDLVARAEEAPPDERGALLAAAVALYQGDLCGDQTMEWVELEYRYPWRRKFLATLYDLADHRWQVDHNVPGALRAARRLIEADPLNEHYRQLLMRLYHAAKDVDAVTREFMDLQALLAEHGLELHPYTRALYERLETRRPPEGDRSDARAG